MQLVAETRDRQKLGKRRSDYPSEQITNLGNILYSIAAEGFGNKFQIEHEWDPLDLKNLYI